MELMKGYKQTEVGLIPDDWKIMSIDQIFDFYSTSNYSKAQMLTDGEVGCFHYGLIHSLVDNNYDISKGVKYFVTKKQSKYEYIKDGDVVMVDASEDLSGINKSIEISGVQDKLYIAGLHTFLLRDKGFYQKNFRGPILNSYFTKAQFYRLAVGMKVYGVSKQQLKTVVLPIPSISEQTSIAQALSDTDAYITSIEKFIEKKRHIKQGSIQELLKPKDGWETKTIKEVATYRRGSFPQPYGLDKWYDDISGFPFVQVFDVDDNNRLKDETKRYISKAAQQMSVFVKKGSIILTIQGSIGRIALTQYDAYVDRTLLIFESFKIPFNSFFFMISIWRIFEIEKELAPGGIIKTITKEALSSFKISYPKIIEQERIAQILSDIDIEIQALEEKLKKAKSIKDGMMQNLLTGKIRLK